MDTTLPAVTFRNVEISWGPAPLAPGDRVRIRSGYVNAGDVYYYVGKSTTLEGEVELALNPADDDCLRDSILAEAIEPYPYSREERIERAIEDLVHEWAKLPALVESDDVSPLLFAILEAGV